MAQVRSGRNPERLWLAISGHGHGHLVQLIPLIKTLQQRYPGLELAVQSSLPASLLRQSFGNGVQIHSEAADFGMLMSGPMRVLAEESLAAYRQFHAAWPQHMATQVGLLQEFRPDLLIGDIPYLPLAAAKQCGIPAVAVCSLNWADILEHYCGGMDGADAIVRAIRQHYAAAELFLRPTPSMPMETLGNTATIGPLVSVGQSRRAELQQKLQLPSGTRLVLLTLGGIAGQVDITQWPSFDDTVFLVPAAWLESLSAHDLSRHFRSIESTRTSFADLFSSCDALITKPGYGAFAGAGCCGLPVLYAERGDWPEEPCLSRWLHDVGRAASIGWTRFATGDFAPALDALLAQPAKPPSAADGASQGLALIESLLTSGL